MAASYEQTTFSNGYEFAQGSGYQSCPNTPSSNRRKSSPAKSAITPSSSLAAAWPA